MTTHTIQPVRVLAICSAIGLVIASAGFGSVFAYRLGIQHSILLAGLSVLMALGLEGCKPLAIAYALRSKSLINGLMLGSLGLVAVTYSLTSELSLVASSKGDQTAGRLAETNAALETVGRKQRIESELRSLGLVRPSETIQAELTPLLSDKRLNNCLGWLENSRLRNTCIEKVSPLQAELGRAERKEKLEADLGKLPSAGVQTIKVGDPGSAALATYLGVLGFTVSTEKVAQWLILVPVLALELGSAFALVLVGSIPVVPAQTQATKPMAQAKRPTKTAKITIKLPPRSWKSSTQKVVSSAVLRGL